MNDTPVHAHQQPTDGISWSLAMGEEATSKYSDGGQKVVQARGGAGLCKAFHALAGRTRTFRGPSTIFQPFTLWSVDDHTTRIENVEGELHSSRNLVQSFRTRDQVCNCHT